MKPSANGYSSCDKSGVDWVSARQRQCEVSETGWEVGQMVGVYRVTESAQVSDG